MTIVLPGATPGLDPTDLVKDPGTDPMLHEIHIFSASGSAFHLQNAQGTFDLYKEKETIFKILVHYPKESEDINAVKEIAQESYSEEAREFISSAADTVIDVVTDFRRRSPQGSIMIVGVGMSGEAIIEALKNNSPMFNVIIFFYPTMAMVNNGTIVDVLKNNGYTKDRARVIGLEGDPTIPLLEKQSSENKDLFLLAVIEKTE